MDWVQVIVLVGTMLGTVLGIVVPFHLHTMSLIKQMQNEMKDFHGRLERQDAEFKGGLLLLEEKFRSKS